jgi:PAS domain S-box-containing protein
MEMVTMRSNYVNSEISESIGDGFFTLDHEWRITYINLQAAAILNRQPQEVLGKVIWEELPEINGSFQETVYRQAIENQVIQHTVVKHWPAGNWYNITAIPSAEGISVYWQDITKHKENENRLSFQANMLSSVHDAICAMDENRIIIYWNDMAEKLFGWSAKEVIGKPSVIQASIPGSSRKKRIAKLIRDGFFTGESVYHHKNGKPICTNVHVRPLLDSQGEYKGYVASFRDISEQKQAEKALRKSEEKYRRLFNSIDQGFFLIDVIFDENNHPIDIQYVETNEAAVNILGRDYTGKHLSEIEMTDESYWYDIYGRVALTGNSIWLEHYSDHDKKWLGLHIFKAGEDESRLVGMIFQDITERKKAEKELRESQEQALALVEKLRQADENKNEFLSILSHELRNPLASIMISLSLQDQVPPGSEEDKQARKVMERQTTQISRIVDDLLDITRINQNKIKLKKERVELNKLVENVVANNIALFAEKEVQLLTQLAPAPLYLDADQARLTQVIGNLLDNAAKFTDKGDKTLVTVSEDESTREAVIRVQDSGMGIQPALVPNLFQAFVQADNSLDRSKGGLGLGLAIAKGMVELHGGSVAYYSEGLGHGTQFTIRLPLPAASIKEKAQEEKGSKPSSRSQRILIIEDNPDIMEILSCLLSHLGHDVAAASNGPEGIAKAKEFRPEALICDIGLPGMSGYEVAEYFRQEPELKEVYLIALSGYAQPKDLEQSKAAGFNRHLAKPVDLETLKKALAEVS